MDRHDPRRRQPAASRRSPAPGTGRAPAPPRQRHAPGGARGNPPIPPRQHPDHAGATPDLPPRLVPPRTAPPPDLTTHACEADVAPGLEAIATAELRGLLGADLGALRVARPGTLAFEYSGDLARLLRPRTILAIYLMRRFAVPRPRALLGDAHFRAIVRGIAAVRALAAPDAYESLYLSAAGSDSAVLTRLKEEIGRATGLRPTAPGAHEGDLHLRLRRAPSGTVWELLIRITPRPLGARPWRIRNLEGALNATVARAMVLLTGPDPRDQFLNLACGSGTLLIERADSAPATRLLGIDNSAEALAIAAANVEAAGYAGRIELLEGDARTLALPDASIDALCADLPFGHLVGTHDDNLLLYPAILAEAGRVARRDAPFALLTHEVRLMERLLADAADWALDQTLRVGLGGLNPRIFLLRRR